RYVLFPSVALFFLSSRRRHTTFSRDWSSDVCSSDLPALLVMDLPAYLADFDRPDRPAAIAPELRTARTDTSSVSRSYLAWKELRSEERRVGKEGRTRR